jgi:hypothetical protein
MLTLGEDEAELIVVLSELLEVEPTGEEGQCPWCCAIRATWSGLDQEHHEWCPWGRLRPAFERLAAN